MDTVLSPRSLLSLSDIARDNRVLCWDFDKTLVNGPNSYVFLNFIKEHPELEHHIITFRDSGAGLLDILERYDISSDRIASIQTLDRDLFYNFARWNGRYHRMALEDVQSQRDTQERWNILGTTPENVIAHMDKCYAYKAETTMGVGSRVLFDDYYDELLPHFEKRGLILVDSLGEISS